MSHHTSHSFWPWQQLASDTITSMTTHSQLPPIIIQQQQQWWQLPSTNHHLHVSRYVTSWTIGMFFFCFHFSFFFFTNSSFTVGPWVSWLQWQQMVTNTTTRSKFVKWGSFQAPGNVCFSFLFFLVFFLVYKWFFTFRFLDYMYRDYNNNEQPPHHTHTTTPSWTATTSHHGHHHCQCIHPHNN